MKKLLALLVFLCLMPQALATEGTVALLKQQAFGSVLPEGWQIETSAVPKDAASASAAENAMPALLVSPKLDLSGAESATLRFALRENDLGASAESFGVYLRKENSSWQLLYATSDISASPNAHEVEISLGVQALSNGVQLGFTTVCMEDSTLEISEVSLVCVPKSVSPSSGDSTSLVFLSGLMIFSCSGFLLLEKRKKIT